jgi:hypothetical protein
LPGQWFGWREGVLPDGREVFLLEFMLEYNPVIPGILQLFAKDFPELTGVVSLTVFITP